MLPSLKPSNEKKELYNKWIYRPVAIGCHRFLFFSFYIFFFIFSFDMVFCQNFTTVFSHIMRVIILIFCFQLMLLFVRFIYFLFCHIWFISLNKNWISNCEFKAQNNIYLLRKIWWNHFRIKKYQFACQISSAFELFKTKIYFGCYFGYISFFFWDII